MTKKPRAFTPPPSPPAPPPLFTEDPAISSHDWRNQAVTTVSADAVLNGRKLPKGSVIKVIVDFDYDHTKRMRYSAPNTAALMLDFANRMYEESEHLLKSFDLSKTVFPQLLSSGKDEIVFDALEKRMAAVLFAYSALEAFANESIDAAYGVDTYVYNRSGESGLVVPQTLQQIEKYVPLAEKLNVVLPQVYGVHAIKGTKLWQTFRRMETIRHRIIHNKQADRVNSIGPTLWSLLTDKLHRNYAKDAKDLVAHFVMAKVDRMPRWFAKCPF